MDRDEIRTVYGCYTTITSFQTRYCSNYDLTFILYTLYVKIGQNISNVQQVFHYFNQNTSPENFWFRTSDTTHSWQPSYSVDSLAKERLSLNKSITTTTVQHFHNFKVLKKKKRGWLTSEFRKVKKSINCNPLRRRNKYEMKLTFIFQTGDEVIIISIRVFTSKQSVSVDDRFQ